MECQDLSTRHWDLHSRAQEKGTLSFESSKFHAHDEESEHEHGHTSTSEHDLLKLLNLPEDTQVWTRFDKRARNYRTTSSSGPLWENVVARITIDDKTGHIMSLEHTKHMTEKDVHRNFPSVRDICTMLLHFSPVTPNQQLKQSFQTFTAPSPAEKVLKKTRLVLQKRFRVYHVCPKCFAALLCGLAFLQNGLAFLKDREKV